LGDRSTGLTTGPGDQYVIEFGNVTTPYKLLKLYGHGPADSLDVRSTTVGTGFTLGAGVGGDVDLLVDLGLKRDANKAVILMYHLGVLNITGSPTLDQFNAISLAYVYRTLDARKRLV